jgi:hypothetical protein
LGEGGIIEKSAAEAAAEDGVAMLASLRKAKISF